MRLDHFHLKEGDTIVILGSRSPYSTKFYSNRVGETGFVLSVESDDEAFLKLHNEVDLYGNIWTAKFTMPDENGEGFITWDDLVARAELNEVTVAVVDKEGTECWVLRGMTHTLPNHLIMWENSEASDLLREKGYMWITEEGYLYATR